MSNVSETAIFDGQEYRKTILDLIQQSTSQICISTYIFESDEFGKEVFDRLFEKSASGISVRWIIDGYGSLQWIQNNHALLKTKNFEIRIFHPMPLSFRKIKSDLPQLDRFFQYLIRMNRRIHQKLFLFDQSVAVMGSRNIDNSAVHWRENTLLIRGNPIAEFVSVFEEIWKRADESFFKNVYRKRKYRFFKSLNNVFTNHLFLLRRNIRLMIQKKFLEAQSEIYITTPYFMPPVNILRQIYKRAKAGVKVYILLPKTTDVPISKFMAESYFARLLKNGVRIFEYEKSVLHAKCTIVDNWVFLGSSNLNRRSFYQDLELDYVVEKEEVIQQIKDQFWIDVQNSTEVLSAPKQFFMKKIAVKIVMRVFSSWF